ncbi:Uncharacterized protein TCM_035080 [Theobroma cacao]|uniref:Uncharacterized protein n=1 Tax=Theobroma cacao TaxID=3641 RepID=A0A061FP10_THECC|nr:Uncharacterized protein TCM_035080 [Theobroma cacao]
MVPVNALIIHDFLKEVSLSSYQKKRKDSILSKALTHMDPASLSSNILQPLKTFLALSPILPLIPFTPISIFIESDFDLLLLPIWSYFQLAKAQVLFNADFIISLSPSSMHPVRKGYGVRQRQCQLSNQRE